MSRGKKSGVFFNCYMKADVHDALVNYAEETGLSKTAVVEKALADYIMDKKPNGADEQTICDFVMTKYKSGQYVYPQAVARNTGFTRAEVIPILEDMPSLEKIRDYRCPQCMHSNLETNVETDEHGVFYCGNCDCEIAVPDINVDVIYRVK